MKLVTVGFDTSCYTTSIALVSVENSTVLSSQRVMLPVRQGERGVRQSEAVFHHVRHLAPLTRACFDGMTNLDIVTVGVADKPRDQEASYMPVFTVGVSFGESLAAIHNIPVYAFSHQRGHIEASRYQSGLDSNSFLAFHLSGGTNEIVRYDEGDVTLLGASNDISAGQLIDRSGVTLGLPFPSGPALEQLALNGACEDLLPISMDSDGLHCHFSGAETCVLQWIQEKKPPQEIAAEIFGLIIRVALKMALTASKLTGIKEVLFTGGVTSSQLFREGIIARVAADTPFRAFFGLKEYACDNAVGIALSALSAYRKEIKNDGGTNH